MIYFMYDVHDIKNLDVIDQNKCQLNVASYKSYRVGILYNDDDIDIIKKLNPVILTEDQFNGFKLLSVTDLNTMKKVVTFGSYKTEVDFTEEELEYVKSILRLFEKYKIRFYIEKEIGDLNDSVADLSKKVSLLERIIIYLVNNKTLPDELNTYCSQLLDKVENNEIELIYDAIKATKEDVVDYYLNTIDAREEKVAKGISEYYTQN